MMEIPILRDLQILQLEQYWVGRYINWVSKHWFDFKKLNKTKVKWTFKIKLLVFSYFLLFGIVYWFVYMYLGLLAGLGLFLIFVIWPVFLLVPVVIVIKLGEGLLLNILIKRNRNELRKNKEMVKIGITGSWGKSSAKHYLSKILGQTGYTVTTPGSYNTVLGIIKVIKMEIFNKVKYFVVEMGAFCRGDIKKITKMVEPEYGLLTAIGKQHLERFGSIKKIRLTKFELVDGIKDKNKVLVNWDNSEIRDWVIKNKKYDQVKKYSLVDKSADFVASNIKINKDGAKFLVRNNNKKVKFETKLFGTINVENLLAAIAMAIIMDVKMELIREAVKKIEPVKNRLEIKKVNKATIIDNTYSSNEVGFRSLLNDLSKLDGKKVLITPGIVELGRLAKSVHQRLGKLAGKVFDEVVLVGESDRTRSLQVGIGKNKMSDGSKIKVWFLEDFSLYWPTIEKLAEEYDWIILENDLPENYS